MENQEPLQMTVISSSDSLNAMIRAETDVAINTAQLYPRDLQQFKADAIAMATMDRQVAESCSYALPVDGKTVTGPSVRLAEIIVSAYGNIKVGARVLSNDGKFITVEAICIDLQKNINISMPVVRSIRKKDGTIYSAHQQGVATQAALKIAYRNAVFSVIPMSITKTVSEAAKKYALGDPAELPVRRAKVLQYFLNNYKVSSDRVLTALGKASIELIDLEDIGILTGYKNAIESSETTIEEVFPLPKQHDSKQQASTDALKNVAKDVAGKAEAKKKGSEAQNKAAGEHGRYKLVAKDDCQVKDMDGEEIPVMANDEALPSKIEGMFKIGDLNVSEAELAGWDKVPL